MPFANAGDIDLYYEVHGEGPPLVFISGLSSSTWTWEGQIPFFKKYYRCIVFDNRGAGLSEKPRGPYSMAGMAADALGLLDRLKIEKAFVFALSMGGMITLELARVAQERISAMLLGCTHAGGHIRIPPSGEAFSLLMDIAGLSREEILRKQTPLFFSSRFQAQNPQAIEEHYRSELKAPLQPEYAFEAQVTAIRRFDCTDAVAQIRTPALVVTGTEDVLVPPANSTWLAAHLPNARLITMPGAGHALHVECRDFLNRIAHGFYREGLGVRG